jgi:hypothetical protein
MNEIPECPKNLPENITRTIRDLGKQWNLAVPKVKRCDGTPNRSRAAGHDGAVAL